LIIQEFSTHDLVPNFPFVVEFYSCVAAQLRYKYNRANWY